MSVLTKDSNGIVAFEDEIGDNLSAVLREKMPNNDILYNEEKWLCEDYNPELCSEMLKAHQTPAYRLLDNKKDNKFVERANTKRKFRTRSESEPNEICALASNGAWPNLSNLNVINGRDKYHNELANKPMNFGERRAIKQLPATPKRHSPARVLLYNNTPSPRSPRNLFQHSNAHRSSPVGQRRGSSLTRLHEYRRSRTKSPPLSRVTSDDSAAEYEAYSRKAKSVTPTPTHRKVPMNRVHLTPQEKLKLVSPSKLRVERRSSSSSIEDDCDVSDQGTIKSFRLYPYCSFSRFRYRCAQ